MAQGLLVAAEAGLDEEDAEGVVLGVVDGVVEGVEEGVVDGVTDGVVLGLEEGDAVGDGEWLCTAGEGWCPRAGVNGLGETTWRPAGASRMAASATAPPTAARPATVTVAGWVPNLRNSERRRATRSAGRLARWAARLFIGAATNAAVGQTSRAAVT